MREGLQEAPVNSDLVKFYDGDHEVGSLRRGLDGLWYPQLPGNKNALVAKRDLIRAYRAVQGAEV